MAIFPNGTLAWTPTNDQAGNYTVTVKVVKDGSVVESRGLEFHVTNINRDYNGVFIDLSTNSGGDGTPQNPYGTYKEACSNLNGKHNLYLRGGVYRNPGYHSDWSQNGRYPSVDEACQGTKDNPIVIRPWGSEYVKLKTDALYGIKIKAGAKHITVQNLEIEGEAQAITLDIALKYWWESNDTMQSSGIVANGDDILIKDNVVHDMPGSGIGATAGAYATIERNIVYNCDWWTIAGSKGIGITSAKGSNANATYKNQIVGNLIFNIEQRLFSHVWKKKFATLTIDEGEAFLIQEGKQQDGTSSSSYNGKYLIKDNLMLFNGKTGVINLAKDVNLTHNSYYNNGGATKQSGFRISHTDHLTIENNAVESNIANTIVYSRDRASSDVNLTHNYAKGVITKDGSTIVGIKEVDRVFNDPENLDFSIISGLPQDIGASSSAIADIKKKLELYNVKVERRHLEVDRAKQTKYIVEHAPGKVDCSHYDDDEDPYVLITDINSTHPIVTDAHSNEFKLYIEHKYGECVENVVDTTPPTLTLKGDNPILLELGANFTDPKADAVDDRDGSLEVTVDGEVDRNRVGEYTLTYTDKDSVGNEASVSRVVKVVDALAPADDGLDIAYAFGKATQGTDKSYHYYKPASYAIDHNDSTNNHTSGGKDGKNWLQIELPHPTKVSKVIIQNANGNAYRLTNAKVYLSDTPYSGSLDDKTNIATLEPTNDEKTIVLDPSKSGNYLLIKGEQSDSDNRHIHL